MWQGPPNQEDPMRTNQRLAQLWLDALATELGALAGTIDTYTDDLNCYLVWLDENSLGLDYVSLEQIRDYIAALDQRGYAGLPLRDASRWHAACTGS